jgi:hypothetical protein
MTVVACCVLAGVIGIIALIVAASALPRARFMHLCSRRGLAALCWLAAGGLFLAGSQYRLLLYISEPARKTEALARVQLLFDEPLGSINIHVEGAADPFADTTRKRFVRLQLLTTDGATFLGEIATKDLKRTVAARKVSYAIAWQQVVRSAGTDEGQVVASRIATIEAFRQVKKLDIDLVVRDTGKPALPKSLIISPNKHDTLALFVGDMSKEVDQAESIVARYRDSSSPAERLMRPRAWAQMPSHDELGGPLKLSLAGGLFFLLVGGVLRVRRRSRDIPAMPESKPNPEKRADHTLELVKQDPAATVSGPRETTNGVEKDEHAVVTPPAAPTSSSRSIFAPALDSSALQRRLAWVAPLFVWSVWSLMILLNLYLVATYRTSSHPLYDEWFFIEQPFSIEWFWQQHAEYRVPLAKFLYQGVIRLTNYDFRFGNFLNVLAVGTLAFLMIRTARKLRGSTSLTDAFFPLALLNVGQGHNFINFWHMNHLLPPFGCIVLLTIIARKGDDPDTKDLVLLALVLMALPLCGPGGLLFVLATSLWLAILGIQRWNTRESARARQVYFPLGVAIVGVALTAFYLWGLEYDPNRGGGVENPHPGLGTTSLQRALSVFGASLGPAAYEERRFLGSPIRPVYAFGPALWLLIGITAVWLAVAWWRRPEERMRIMGLFLFLGAGGALMLMVSWARAGIVEQYIFQHGQFLIYSMLALSCVYLAWQLVATPNWARFVQGTMLLAVYLFLPSNVDIGFGTFASIHEQSRSFEDDVRAGVSISELAQGHEAPLVGGDPPAPEMMADAIRALKRAGVAFYQHLPDGPMPDNEELSAPSRSRK